MPPTRKRKGAAAAEATAKATSTPTRQTPAASPAQASAKKAPKKTPAGAGAGKRGAKQQTILDSLNKSALRRKNKAPAAAEQSSEESGGEEQEHAENEAVAAGSSTATRKPTRVKSKTPVPVAPASDSEREEQKSEERGPPRERSSRGGALAVQRKRGGDGTNNTADQILSGSFLLSAGNSSELSRRLKQTWTTLQQTPNQHQHDGDDVPLEKLRLVCTELLHDKVLDHSEKNVRSLASCCFVEMLRIYAPDMPFKSNEELYDAFQLLLEQLRSLTIEGSADRASSKAASSTDLHHLYVLESLASVKSCLLVLGMDYTPEEADEPLVVQLFRTLFNTIRKEHSVKIENLMLSIMVSCVEESDTIEQALLDAILSPLVHSNPNIEPTTSNDGAHPDTAERGPYHMAQELIRRTSDHLQSHLSHFFNSVLVDAPATFTSKASELKEHVYALIYEVHKVNSSLLLYVLPNVCMQLQVDEVATRSEAIALMGRLFASAHADYGHDFMKNFRDFLGRFRDVSKEIRLQMVQVCAIVWQRKPELASSIEKEFVSRLADPEWEVRRLVVNEVCDLAANNLDVVSEECLRQVGERMKDKRVVLRKETMTGLSQVYAAHVSAYWAPETEDGDEHEDGSLSLAGAVPTMSVKKLGWVPDYVLKCFAYPQQELKLRVIQLLDDILLPKAFTEFTRAKGLLFVYHSLDGTAREALRRVFIERAKCQSVLETFLTARKLSRSNSTDPQQASALFNNAKSVLQAGMAPLFNETDNLGKLLDQLGAWKDQTVFKQLELLCDHSKSQQEYRNARDRLVKSVGSKSPLGEFLKNFCRKLTMLTVSEGTIGALLRFFVGSGLPHHRENRSVTDLLAIVSKSTPQLFSAFVQAEIEAILTENDDSERPKGGSDDDEPDRDNKVILSLLNVLSQFSEYWRKRNQDAADLVDREAADSTPSDTLKNYLKQCCLGIGLTSASVQDDGAAAKFAAQILANFYGEAKEIESLVTKLCSKKILVGPSVPTAVSTLHSLHVFAKRCPLHLFHHSETVSSLWHSLMENFILQAKQESNGEPTKLKKSSKTGFTAAKAAEVRCLAIKVASDVLLHGHEGDSANLTERSRELMKLLFDLLRSDGRMWGSSGSLPVKYRMAAACNIMKLLRHRTIESLLALTEWHILGFAMQDSAEEVRKAFVKKLSANLMKNTIPHPHKYLSYLVLAATESNSALKKTSRGLLGAAVERMRRVFEASSSRSSHTANEVEDEEDRQSANALMVPEYALPYVIHLLAHHPDFPSPAATKSFANGLRGSLASDPIWSEQVAYLDFFIDGLMPANTAGADNIAFLLQILTKLSDCHDSSDPKSVAIYPLIECAVSLLKRRIKNQSNLKAFPGKIYLPKQLYSAGKASDRRQSVKSNRPALDGDEEEPSPAEEPTRKKSRLTASLSPIKLSDTLSTFLTMNSPPLSAQKRKASPASSTKSRRRSLQKSPATPSTAAILNNGDEATPSRRQSLMRKARSQAKTFVADSESDDDSDSFVPRASVASRATKRESTGSTKLLVRQNTLEAEVPAEDTGSDSNDTPQRSTPIKRGRNAAQELDEETKGSDHEDADEMTSFRASRRRRRS